MITLTRVMHYFSVLYINALLNCILYLTEREAHACRAWLDTHRYLIRMSLSID